MRLGEGRLFLARTHLLCILPVEDELGKSGILPVLWNRTAPKIFLASISPERIA